MGKVLSYINNWIEAEKEMILLRMYGLHVECGKITSNDVWIAHWAEDGSKVYLHYSPKLGWDYQIED